MGDTREVFPSLEDDTGVGKALSQRVEGDAAAAKNGAIGFAYKDQAGNVALVTLTTGLKVPVDISAALQKLYNSGTVPAVLSSAEDVAKITLDISQTYGCVGITFSSTRLVRWELVQDNDGSETNHGSWVQSAGDMTSQIKEALADLEVISGGSGVQELILRGTQLIGGISDLHATIGARR